MRIHSKEFLPVEIVYHPAWWHGNFGMDFGWDYFFDPDMRVAAERRMEQILHEKFGQFGYGVADPRPEPVIGPVHLAAGFLSAAIWGCTVQYFPGASPQAICRNLTIEQLDAMEEPDPLQCREFRALVGLIETLKGRFGRVTGDIGWDSLQNLALDLMGSNIYLAYFTQPEMVRRVYEKINRSTIRTVNYIRGLTGTSSISVNRSVARVDPAINLNSNCTVQMISNEQYEAFILPHEIGLARALQPYGVHHCGQNMHMVAEGYAKIPDCCFFDVGWGSDVAHCRRLLPEAFFNLRLSPVRIRECTPEEVRADIETLLAQVGPLDQVGLCCINMDHGTPDENVAAIFETAEKYRRIGA